MTSSPFESFIQPYAVLSGPMTTPDNPVTGHPEEAGAAVNGGMGVSSRPGVKITIDATVDGVAVGSRVAPGVGAEAEGEDDPHDETNPAMTTTTARWRTALILE